MRAILLASLLAFSLGGCVQSSAQEPGSATDEASPTSGPMSTVPVDAAACKAAGGVVDRRGRGQFEMCVHPYADAGTACTDNQQCDGKCVTAASDETATDGEIVGQCQADDALFGCFAEVVDGKRVRAICID